MRREAGSPKILVLIIPELRGLVLTKRHVGSGNEIVLLGLKLAFVFLLQSCTCTGNVLQIKSTHIQSKARTKTKIAKILFNCCVFESFSLRRRQTRLRIALFSAKNLGKLKSATKCI